MRIAAYWPLACGVAFGAALLTAVIMPTGTIAQSETPAPTPAPAKPATPAAEKPAAHPQGKIQVPIDQALLLVRATLLTLNDANHSGNYTVFRDLASLEFQARNSSADLALVFAEMRRSNLSLFSVILLSPQLAAAPEVDADGRLRVSGYVPTSPQQIKFDLIYESSSRQWKLLNINISTTPGQAAKPAEAEQKPEAKAPVPHAKTAAKQPAPPKAPSRAPQQPAAPAPAPTSQE